MVAFNFFVLIDAACYHRVFEVVAGDESRGFVKFVAADQHVEPVGQCVGGYATARHGFDVMGRDGAESLHHLFLQGNVLFFCAGAAFGQGLMAGKEFFLYFLDVGVETLQGVILRGSRNGPVWRVDGDISPFENEDGAFAKWGVDKELAELGVVASPFEDGFVMAYDDAVQGFFGRKVDDKCLFAVAGGIAFDGDGVLRGAGREEQQGESPDETFGRLCP